jgi:membrane-anchored protein YejM (alkaline phosphatase superfamily)
MRLGLLGIRDGYYRLTIAAVINIALIFSILLWNSRQHDFGALSGLYFLTVILGYYVLPVYLVSSVLYLVFSPFRRFSLFVASLVITGFVFYFLIDVYTYSITRMHIDLFWINWIINDFDAFGLTYGTLSAVLAAFLILVAVEVGIFLLARRVAVRRWVIVSFWGVLLLSFAVSQTLHAVAYEENDARITGLSPYLPFYYGITSHSTSAKYGELLPVGLEDTDVAGDDYEGPFTYPLKPIVQQLPPGKQPPNIIVLLFESWRYDAISPELTPNTSALAEKSLVSTRHVCSGNSTVAGVFGLFYGLHASYWGAVKASNARIHNPVLIDVLEDNGYSFGIFAKSNFKRHKIKDATFRGIQVHEDFAGPTAVEQDADMTRQLIEFMRSQTNSRNPFFTFAFYKANHAPYKYRPSDTIFTPADDQNLLFADNDTDPTEYFNDYLNSTRYVDALIGDVIDEAESLGLMDNTIIIITTDHGESFNDNRSNYWGHGTNFTQYQALVPLVFYAPGKAPRVMERRTSHVDISPTILETFLGCTSDVADYSNGVNLYDDMTDPRPFVVGSYVNHAFLIGENVYEMSPIHAKSYKFYDITRDASAPPPEMLNRIVREISRFYVDGGTDDSGRAPHHVAEAKAR